MGAFRSRRVKLWESVQCIVIMRLAAENEMKSGRKGKGRSATRWDWRAKGGQKRSADEGDDCSDAQKRYKLVSSCVPRNSGVKRRNDPGPSWAPESESSEEEEVEEDVVLGRRTSISSEAYSTELRQETSSLSETGSMGPNAACHSCCGYIKASLEILLQKSIEHTSLLKQLVRGRGGDTAGNAPRLTDTSRLPQFPLRNVEDVVAFDKTLEKDEVALEQFKAKVATIGGQNAAANIRNVCSTLLSNSLSRGLSWTGLRGGKAVGRMLWSRTVIEVVQTTRREGLTNDFYKKVLQDWLRHAGDRCRKETMKLNEKQNDGSGESS